MSVDQGSKGQAIAMGGEPLQQGLVVQPSDSPIHKQLLDRSEQKGLFA